MRQKWRFHQGWYFTAENMENDVTRIEPERKPELWEEVTLPHTFRLEPYIHTGVMTAQGIGVYYKRFPLDANLREKNLFMTFEAVMGVTDVWLNGVLLHTKLADKTTDQTDEAHTNYGGYLPFVVCLNDVAYFDGSDNILVVRTNNQDNGQVPPGKPQELLDFTYFGGIYRNVWLEAVEKVYITDPLYEDVENGGGILIEYPLISTQKSIVAIKTQICSTTNVNSTIILTHEISKTDGKCVVSWKESVTIWPQSLRDFNVELEINNPDLWSLDSPSLYHLTTSIWAENNMQDQKITLLDRKITRFGIRQIEVDRNKGLLINGNVQSLLSGVNRHQDYPIIGNAASASMQKRDAILFKKAGFQVVRAAHYPMSEHFLDACDELGLLLIEATPGWQWYPTDEPEPFSSRVRNDIRQMVRRDRNHPCVLAYEIALNETYHVPYGFTRESAKVALAEQKSAKIAAESYGYDASPKANGLDRESDFIYGFQQPLEKTEKAVMFLREYTDCWIESYGQFSSRRVTRGRTDGFYPYGEARNLQKANQMLWASLEEDYSLANCYALRKENPAFVGCAIWTGIDSRGARSQMSPCGIWDGFRLPKTSYWAFASQHVKEPMLYLASEWTEKAPVLDKSDGVYPFGTDDFRDIYVYSNAASVVLTVEQGDTILWEGREKPYTEWEATLLPHPPFRFKEVPYRKGTVLRACGYDLDGNLIAKDERQTAGAPHHIQLWADFLGIPMEADGNDLVLLHANILDKNGMLCTGAEHSVYFQIEGDAEIIGTSDLLSRANPASAEAGIASAYLRAGKTVGTVLITALANGLCSDHIEISLKTPKYQDIPSGHFEKISDKKTGRANLSTHYMSRDEDLVSLVDVIPLAEVDGELYPDSIGFHNIISFELRGESYLETGCKIQSGDQEAELLFYLDDVLGWHGKASQKDRITIPVGGAKELKVKLRTNSPTKALLLSPYLWNAKIEGDESELRENIAFGKPAFASVNSKAAEDIWNVDSWGWLGGSTADGEQEWYVDLGGLFDVRNAMVHVGGQMGSDCTFYQYEIHTSSDGTHWVKQTENRRTSWSNGVLDYFTAKDVRYVKVLFVKVDGILFAGIQKFEIYQDYGVDSVLEYALKGIVVDGNDLVFSQNCLDYTLPVQNQLTIRALACDFNAKVSICGKVISQPKDGRIQSVEPVTVWHDDCCGTAVIEVCAASGRGIRRYNLHFAKEENI